MQKMAVLISVLVTCGVTGFPVLAQQGKISYQYEKTISLPGDGGWDYLAVDSVHQKLYVSHGDRVHVIDLTTGSPVASLDSLQGVHGIAIADDLGKGFISNGQGNAVTVFDLQTLQKEASIPVTGMNPDCITYDPYSRQVFTFNGRSQSSTVINARTLKVVGTIPLGGSPEFAVADGKGRIYNNLEDKNEIVVLDTKARKVLQTYPLTPCGGPSALAIDIRHERLFTACRENKGLSVLDARSGKVIQTLPIGGGVDAARFDESHALIFASNGDGTVTIIHEDSPDRYRVVQTLETRQGARTMALNPRTHKIYLSVGQRDPSQRRKVIPGTFGVLVYGMK